MPLLGHGLVGLGIGAATSADVRSPWLRNAWLGAVVTLAYLPDLLEWFVRLAGYSMPHSAWASLPMTVLGCAVLALTLRFMLHERAGLPLLAGAIALASHGVLDLVDGGIPLWWPFSRIVAGPDWIPNDRDGLGGALVKEVCLFAPFAAAGCVCAVWRKRAGVASICAAIVGLELVLVGCIMGQILLTCLAGGALVLLTLVVYRYRPGWRQFWLIVPLVPVLLLAGAELCAAQQMRWGRECYRERDYARAQEHFVCCARYRSIGLNNASHHMIAVCHMRLGQEETAYRLFRDGLDHDPRSFSALRGLADLYMTARDERFRKPHEAVRMAKRLVPAAGNPGEKQLALWTLERARREAGISD